MPADNFADGVGSVVEPGGMSNGPSVEDQHHPHKRGIQLSDKERRTLGLRVKELRLSRGVTQKSMAEGVLIPWTMLSQYERGHSAPTYVRLARMARYFGVTLDVIMGRSPMPVSTPEPLPSLAAALSPDAADQQQLQQLGQRIGLLRRAKGMTQPELALVLGTTRWTVGAYELGRYPPDPVRLSMLASFFGVSLDQLLGTLHDQASHPSAERAEVPPEPPHDEIIVEENRSVLLVYIDGEIRRLTPWEEALIRHILTSDRTR